MTRGVISSRSLPPASWRSCTGSIRSRTRTRKGPLVLRGSTGSPASRTWSGDRVVTGPPGSTSDRGATVCSKRDVRQVSGSNRRPTTAASYRRGPTAARSAATSSRESNRRCSIRAVNTTVATASPTRKIAACCGHHGDGATVASPTPRQSTPKASARGHPPIPARSRSPRATSATAIAAGSAGSVVSARNHRRKAPRPVSKGSTPVAHARFSAW